MTKTMTDAMLRNLDIIRIAGGTVTRANFQFRTPTGKVVLGLHNPTVRRLLQVGALAVVDGAYVVVS